MKVELRDNEGKVIGVLDTERTHYFTVETIWGGKSYKIEFTHPRDPTTHTKDLTRISGAQMNAK